MNFSLQFLQYFGPFDGETSKAFPETRQFLCYSPALFDETRMDGEWCFPI